MAETRSWRKEGKGEVADVAIRFAGAPGEYDDRHMIMLIAAPDPNGGWRWASRWGIPRMKPLIIEGTSPDIASAKAAAKASIPELRAQMIAYLDAHKPRRQYGQVVPRI